MARMNITIDDRLENEFRIMVATRLGLRKGNIQKAIEESLKLWIEENKKQKIREVFGEIKAEIESATQKQHKIKAIEK